MAESTVLRADAALRRAQIVQAAARIMVAEGTDVPMERVAREAGVGVGTLYRRFPDRCALLVAVVEAGVQKLVDGMVQARREEPTAWDALVRGLSQSVQVRLAMGPHAATRRDLFMQVRDEPTVNALYLQFAQVVEELVVDAQREGNLRPDVGAGDVVQAFSLVRGFSAIADPELDRCLVSRTLALIIDGLRAGPATALPGDPIGVADLRRA